MFALVCDERIVVSTLGAIPNCRQAELKMRRTVNSTCLTAWSESVSRDCHVVVMGIVLEP
jgi:hypothetical protein